MHIAQVLSKRCNPAHAKIWFNFFFKWILLKWTLESFFLHVYFDDMTIRVIFMVKWKENKCERTSGTQGKQLEEGMKVFLKLCGLTFMCKPHILPFLQGNIFLSTHCLYEANTSTQFLPCIWVSESSVSLWTFSLISLVAAAPLDLELYLHFPQLPKVTQIVSRGTLSITQFIRQVGLISFTLFPPEVVFSLIVIPFCYEIIRTCSFCIVVDLLLNMQREN